MLSAHLPLPFWDKATGGTRRLTVPDGVRLLAEPHPSTETSMHLSNDILTVLNARWCAGAILFVCSYTYGVRLHQLICQHVSVHGPGLDGSAQKLEEPETIQVEEVVVKQSIDDWLLLH